MSDTPFPKGMVEWISEFLVADANRTTGLDSYDEIFNSPVMFPLQRRLELEEMIRTARSINPKVVMEIGADKAGSLYHWCKCLPTVERVIACEIRGTPYMHDFEKAFPHIEFFWCEGSSYDPNAVRPIKYWLREGLPDSIDILFIDGDKSHFDTDFHCYRSLMSRDGIVFMHDISHDPMKSVFESLRGEYRSEIIHITTEGREAQQREKDGIPATTAYEAWLRYWGESSCGVGVLYMN